MSAKESLSPIRSTNVRILLALCAVGLATILLVGWKHEPSYQGRSLSSWIAAYDEVWCVSPQVMTPRLVQAQEPIRQMAPKAIPFLIEWMYCERPKWKDTALATMSRISGQPIPFLRPTTPVFGNLMEDKYRLAILGFRALGPEGAPAVPALTPLMVSTNQKVSSAAIVALTCIGQKGLPAFLSALTNASAHNRNLAAANIGCLVNQGFDLTGAVPALVKALDDPDRWVPVNAATSLGAIHLCPNISVPALKKALKHPNATVRFRAAAALAEFRDQRETGMSALRLLTQGADDSVHFQAYLALRTLTNAPPP